MLNENQINSLKSGEAGLTAMVSITRKATGNTENYTLVFTPLSDKSDLTEPKQKDK